MIINDLKLTKILKSFTTDTSYKIEEGAEQTLLLTKNDDIVDSISIFGDTAMSDVELWLKKHFGLYLEPQEAIYILCEDEDEDKDKDKDKDEEIPGYIFDKEFPINDFFIMVDELNDDCQETQDLVCWLQKEYPNAPDYIWSRNYPAENRAEQLYHTWGGIENIDDIVRVKKFKKQEIKNNE